MIKLHYMGHQLNYNYEGKNEDNIIIPWPTKNNVDN